MQCQLETGPIDTYSVQLAVKGKGAALWDSPVENFTYTETITGISPLTAGCGGNSHQTLDPSFNAPSI